MSTRFLSVFTEPRNITYVYEKTSDQNKNKNKPLADPGFGQGGGGRTENFVRDFSDIAK